MLSPRNGIFQPRLSSDVYSCSNPELRTQNSGLRTQDSGLRTQNSELRTQNSELRTQNSGLRTQDSERRAPSAERRTPNAVSNILLHLVRRFPGHEHQQLSVSSLALHSPAVDFDDPSTQVKWLQILLVYDKQVQQFAAGQSKTSQ